MIRGILKAASTFPDEGRNLHEARRIHFHADTKPARAESNSSFIEMRKIEERKLESHTLSYWTLRFNDPATNQEYLEGQREEV